MGHRCVLSLLAAILVGVPGPASADTVLVTPVLYATPGQILNCQILNAGTRDISVVIEFVWFTGIASIPFPFTVEPGASQSLTTGPAVVLSARYCRFSGRFNKTGVRATGSVHESGGAVVVMMKAE